MEEGGEGEARRGRDGSPRAEHPELEGERTTSTQKRDRGPPTRDRASRPIEVGQMESQEV